MTRIFDDPLNQDAYDSGYQKGRAYEKTRILEIAKEIAYEDMEGHAKAHLMLWYDELEEAVKEQHRE